MSAPAISRAACPHEIDEDIDCLEVKHQRLGCVEVVIEYLDPERLPTERPLFGVQEVLRGGDNVMADLSFDTVVELGDLVLQAIYARRFDDQLSFAEGLAA